MRLGYDRFVVVLDACVLFPMLVRDVLLTFAHHEFFIPRWSEEIHNEWGRNLTARFAQHHGDALAQMQVNRIRRAMDGAFPNATVQNVPLPSEAVQEVDPKDRHVVMTAITSQAEAVVTFNLRDFAADVMQQRIGISMLHPDEFISDLIDLNEMRAISVFRELRPRRKNPPIENSHLIDSVRLAGLPAVAAWLESSDVVALL